MKNLKSLLSLLVLLVPIIASAQLGDISIEVKNNNSGEFENKSVRIIYLVSSDREVDNDYLLGIEKAAISVQNFYQKELNGITFKLNNPIVEVLKCDKKANYFYTNPCDDNPANWGYFNTYNEVNKLLRVEFNDTNYTWVIYSDGPGNKGRGGSGVCVMPEDDLKGLVGKHPTQPDIDRWHGGLAHELGHAFGLNHPSSPENHPKAIMWTGIYGYYPDLAYFTDEDKIILKSSIFFNEDKKVEFKYPEGHFEGIDKVDSNWTEYKINSKNKYYFKLQAISDDFFILKSNDRDLFIKLPLDKGQSYISLDNGETWRSWWWID